MNTITGLKEKIAHAETEAEVINLLASGQTFNYASPRTKLSWKHAAQRRIRHLQATVEQPTSTEQSAASTKKKSNSKKTSNKK